MVFACEYYNAKMEMPVRFWKFMLMDGGIGGMNGDFL